MERSLLDHNLTRKWPCSRLLSVGLEQLTKNEKAKQELAKKGMT
jgi:hypothetical protein